MTESRYVETEVLPITQRIMVYVRKNVDLIFLGVLMGKNRITKIIGYIDAEIAKKWYIEEHSDKPISQALDIYIHIAKHAKEYTSVDSMNCTLENVSSVIKEPDYVYYDEDKKGIEFYKLLIENVVVIVQVSKKRELDIASIYPVTENKIANRKAKEESTLKMLKEKRDKELEKEMYDKYVINKD